MKFYLAVEHVQDNGADYFKFSSLHLAIRYIQEEGLDDWTLTDRPFYQEGDEKTEDLVAEELYRYIG